MVLPLFEMLYERVSVKLWFYDEHGNYLEFLYNRTGVRHGCVHGVFLFCLVPYPVYARLRVQLGHEGALYACSAGVYLVSDPLTMATALVVVRPICKKSGTPY